MQELALKYEAYKWQTIGLSCFSLVFLMIGKSFVAPFIRKKWRFVVPCELLLVGFEQTYNSFESFRLFLQLVFLISFHGMLRCQLLAQSQAGNNLKITLSLRYF